MKQKQSHWHDYLWAASALYLILGLFNITFAWLGLLCFFIPLLMALFGADKGYCNRYCGRGQLFSLLGNRFKLSRRLPMPRFLSSTWFRYAFLAFFLVMFGSMLFSTYLVFSGSRSLQEAVTLLWTFRVPWHFAAAFDGIPAWAAQFAFGFYSVMLTSSLLGFVMMLLFKPRAWCAMCPMGTMTQAVCKIKHRS